MDEKTVTIELKLPLPAVNYIVGLLGKQPFEHVADLIQGIREQPMPEVPQAEQVQ
jgi:hypothetical protein